MKRKPASKRRPARQVPPFYPVPVRGRHDGWTLERQARFLGMLAETGSVLAACGAVGMSRNTAYALRRKPDAESFAAAWDAALGRPIRKVTVRDTLFLAYSGLVRVQIPRPLSRILAETRQFRAFAADGPPRTGGLSRRARLTPGRGEFFLHRECGVKGDRSGPSPHWSGPKSVLHLGREREDRDEGSVR